MLNNSPVVKSNGARVLFIGSAAITALLLQWMHHLRLSGDQHGLATIFFVLFAYEDYYPTIFALLILMVAALTPTLPALRNAVRWIGEHPISIAGISLVAMVFGTLFIYHNHPLSMDEYAAVFQSRIFANGHLSGKFPVPILDWLIPPGFQNYFLNVSRVTGEVSETYWPGFALLLTPFTLIGAPWLCNPVVSALTLLAIHKLALELFDDHEAAGLALLLTIASPVIFANGISYYSMPAHLLCNAVFSLLLLRPTTTKAALAGFVGSVALCLHNPVPHILFALPWLAWLSTRPDRSQLLISICAGYLPLCLLLGIGWFLYSGQLVYAVDLATAGAEKISTTDQLHNRLSIFSLPDTTVLLARVIGLAKIWIWAVPGLLILAATGTRNWRSSAPCRLLAASALLTVLGYIFVPVDQGHGWGYRYFHSAWLALPMLATAALYRPVKATVDPHAVFSFSDDSSRGFITVCALLMLIIGIGWRAWEMQSFMAADLAQLPHYTGAEPQIVIVNPAFSFYGADLVQNDPFLRGNVTRMYSHGPQADNAMMTQYYPGFHLVHVDRYGTVWSKAAQTSSLSQQHQQR